MTSPDFSQEVKRQALYNPNNKYVTVEDIESFLSKGGIQMTISPKRLKYWQTAFVHKSYSVHRKVPKGVIEEDSDSDSNTSTSEEELKKQNIVPVQKTCYENFEWLGDAIIQSVVSEYLYTRFKKQNQAFFTTIRSKLVKNETLATFTDFLGFTEFIILSKYEEEKCNGRKNVKILGDTFEAFVGCLFLETKKNNGYELAEKFMKNIIEMRIDMPTFIMTDDNYKTILKEYFQQTFGGKTPDYELVEKDDKGIIKSFTVCVKDTDGEIISYGTAKNKQDAEKAAAKDACIKYSLISVK